MNCTHLTDRDRRQLYVPAVLVALTMAMSGCFIGFDSPLVPPSEAIADVRVVGDWCAGDVALFRLTPDESLIEGRTVYRPALRDGDATTSYVWLGDVAGATFLIAGPVERSEDTRGTTGETPGAFAFARLRFDGDRLLLAMPDAALLTRWAESEARLRSNGKTGRDATTWIAASSDELRSMVVELDRDERFFRNELSLTRSTGGACRAPSEHSASVRAPALRATRAASAR